MNTLARQSTRPGRHQEGVTLIVALIMLIMLTLLALTSFNLGKSTLQVVNNMQVRDAGIGAARQVIEEAISSTAFYDSPTDILQNPCDGNKNTRCIDTNGDLTPDVTVALETSCVKVHVLKDNDLGKTGDNTEYDCSIGGGQNSGIVGADGGGNSQCADAVWDLKATATDVQTQSTVVVVQGVATRNNVDTIANVCK
jgi:Tfp pilus assembly protein PilX